MITDKKLKSMRKQLEKNGFIVIFKSRTNKKERIKVINLVLNQKSVKSVAGAIKLK